MGALTILIIRHGEKPDREGHIRGLTQDGQENRSSLTVRGWQRAGAWAALFGAGLGGADYPKPDVIYAASPERARERKPRLRQLQTIQPLAELLRLEPVLRYGKGDEDAMADEILPTSGVVLVSWEYELIVEALIPRLLGRHTLQGIPTEWNPGRFDVVLRLDRIGPDAPWRYRQLSPRLLAGDSDAPVSMAARDRR